MRRLAAIAALALGVSACLEAPSREPGQWPIAKAELEALAKAAAPLEPGEAAYRRTCVACHGIDGKGSDGKLAADFSAPTGPLAKPDELLRASILNGVKGTIGIMPPHRTLLTDDEVTAVLAYVRKSFGAGIVPSAADAGAPAP